MMKLSLRTVWILTAILLMPFSAWAQQSVSISWTPQELANGSPCLFLVKAHEASAVTGTWQGHSLSFFRQKEDSDSWYSLAGIDVSARPGSFDLTVQVAIGGNTQTFHRDITVGSAPYKEIPLTVPEKFVKPDPEAQKIIAADQEIKNRIFADSAQTRLWTDRFSPPLRSAPRTDSFGTRRTFNGSLASVHRGLDYRAATGTPVMAVSSGRVLLARPLYYEGNCVIIDHGLGFTTIYMHLSKFEVKEGEQVSRGQVIALSGGTGRATGPHLHLSARWQGEYLDPAKLFLLRLPSTERP